MENNSSNQNSYNIQEDELFITEMAAANYAGVSLSTLERFVEAGYLKIETSDQGEKLFSTSEIFRVFGKGASSNRKKHTNQKSDTFFDRRILKKGASVKENNETTRLNLKLDSQVEVEKTKDSSLEGNSVEYQDTQNKIEEHKETEDTSNLSIYDPMESEISRHKSSIKLLEKMLDMKEAQIHDLKDEARWLKDRVERLEEQRSVDSALIFSSTQGLQRVLESSQKKPIMQSFLEFFGFVSPSNSTTLPTVQPQQIASTQSLASLVKTTKIDSNSITTKKSDENISGSAFGES